MDEYVILFPLIILPVAIYFVYMGYNRTKKRAAEEEGKTPIFEARCGGQVGIWFYKGPFIRVSVYPEFLVVAGKEPWTFATGSFTIEAKNRIVGKSYRLIHKNANAPEKIELWLGADFERAVANLR